MPIPRDPDYDGPSGLDLADPALLREVRALVLSAPEFQRAVSQGQDADDLFQAVVLGLLTRQQGDSAFDRCRSSLGSYVRMVTRSITSHVLDSSRRKAWEVVGTEDDAAHDAEGNVDETGPAPAPRTAIASYLRAYGIDVARATTRDALEWRHRAEESRILALVYRVAEGLYLQRVKEEVESFPAWVRASYEGSAQSAYDRVYVAWYAVHRGGTIRELPRLADTSWRELRTMAREAYTAAHGTRRAPPTTQDAENRPDPEVPPRVAAIRTAIASYRATEVGSQAHVERAIELADLVSEATDEDWAALAARRTR